MANLSELLGLGDAAGKILGTIDKLNTTQEEKLTLLVQLLAIERDAEKAATAADLKIRELETSDKGLRAWWRPLTMLAITGILVNNYVVAGWVKAYSGTDISVTLPEWLLQVFLAGLFGLAGLRSFLDKGKLEDLIETVLAKRKRR